jgi:hypothetical protein
VSVIKYENFDSVTPPAMPAGWNVSTGSFTLATIAATGGISPTSPPNMLECVSGAGAYGLATWGTPDGAGGDVTVQANVAWIGIGTKAKMGLTARGSAATLDFSGTTYYTAYCDPATGVAGIATVIGGVLTPVLTASIPGALATLAWYQFTFTLSGTSLALYVLRLGDSKWLNSSGSWVAGQTAVVSGTDGSITGAGHAGILGDDGGTIGVIDDWYLTTVINPFTPTVMHDRVKEATLTLGTGPLLLLGAEVGYQSFEVVGDGSYVYYGIQDTLTTDWEVGLGTYDASGPFLHRLAVYDSSTGPGTLVNFQAGSYKDVFNTVPAWLIGRAGYSLFDHYADSASIGTSETPLYSDSLAPNTFSSDGDKVRVTYGVELSATTTATKRLRLKLGGSTIFDSTAMTSSAAGNAIVAAILIRDSPTSVRYSVGLSATGASASSGPTSAVGRLAGLTLADSLSIVLTGTVGGTGVADGDITAIMGTLTRYPEA